MRLADAGTVIIGGGVIDATGDDGIRTTNTNLTVDLIGIGQSGRIPGDGIEVINDDGGHHAVEIRNSNIFGLGEAGLGGNGILLNSQSGRLTATLSGNQIASDLHTIASLDGGKAGSLILDLRGNSTLATNTAGQETIAILGQGTDSTIVRSWAFPNQVIGGAGGVLFHQVSFDADADPANGYQQVDFTGQLAIGSASFRVRGDGLRFSKPRGDLHIGKMTIFNDGGYGLWVDQDAFGSLFDFTTGESAIDTINGTASNLP